MPDHKESNIYYVYQYLRSKDSDTAESGTPYYIGKGKGPRAWRESHCPSDKSLIEILVTGLSEKAAHELEIMLIKKYGRADLGTGILRNLTNGGEGVSGRSMSEVTRAKNGAAHKGQIPWNKGKHHSEETKAKLRAANVGKILSENTRRKMSESKQNMSSETKAKISSSKKGKLKSEETKAKMRFAQRHMSNETREKMSSASKGKPKSAEHRAKIGAAKKGKIPWNKGIKHTAEAIENMKLAHRDKNSTRKDTRISTDSNE